MDELIDEASEYVMELASSQRMGILFRMFSKDLTPSSFAKEIDATRQEVYRNFTRLEKRGLIKKTVNGTYTLTTFGNTICTQVPSLVFLLKNRKYFESHDFGDIPHKFRMRCGQLAVSIQIKGFSKILEKWKEIYKNSQEYIFEIASEVPLDLIEPLVEKISSGVLLNHLFSESAVIPKGRKALLKKLNFDKFVQEGLIERKMVKNVQTVIILNEKEACIMFPKLNGEPDLSEMFYSKDHMFHEWCLDYFRYCWYNSDMFQESKLKE